MTDLLNIIIIFFRIYDSVVPILYNALYKTSSTKILDLCSGGGGAIERVQSIIKRNYNYELDITLSDLYPNDLASKRIKACGDKSLRYEPCPIDATKTPPHLKGFRTLFTCFHHFDPQSGKKILNDAVIQKQGIAIFELSERSIKGLLGILFLPLLIIFMTPFLRPFSLGRLFFTYLLPLVPLAFIYDGIISQLRSYNHVEMLELADEIDHKNYHWESGLIKHKYIPVNINYLIGYINSR